MDKLICPNCGSTDVKEDDWYGTDISRFGLYLTLNMCGHCKDCKRQLAWDVWYNLSNPSVRDMTAYDSCYEGEEYEEEE